jgi:thymidylate kinase
VDALLFLCFHVFMNKRGKLIMIDGIDGSGKTTITQYWKEYLESQGKKVFDLKSYWKAHDRHPTFEEIKDYDVLLSAEMSYTVIGKVLREELINKARLLIDRAHRPQQSRAPDNY